MQKFNKLISNIAFRPSLIADVSSYKLQLKKEERLRKSCFYLAFILVLVQISSIVLSPKPSLTTSLNDIVYGANSKEQIIDAYSKNRDSLGRQDIKQIYDHYGIGLEQIISAKTAKFIPSQRDYIIIGRTLSTGNFKFVPLSAVNGGGLYQNNLNEWSKKGNQVLSKTIAGTNRFGSKFWLLMGSGNIIFEEFEQPSNLQISSGLISENPVRKGGEANFIVQFRNTGTGTAKNFTISDSLPNGFAFDSYSSDLSLRFNRSGKNLSWTIDSNPSELAPSTRWHLIRLNFKIIDPNQVSTLCNVVSLDAMNQKQSALTGSSTESCVGVVKPICPGSGSTIPISGVNGCYSTCPDGSRVFVNQSCETPLIICQNIVVIGSPYWSKKIFKTSILNQKGGVPQSADYYINDRLVARLPFNNKSEQSFAYDFANEGIYTVKVIISAQSGLVEPSKTCEIALSISKPKDVGARVSTDSLVTNMTQNIKNADNTTANPGDKLKYTIYVYNYGESKVVDLELKGEYGENVSDILEYADLVNKADAVYNPKTGSLSWNKVNILPGERVEKSFIFQIKKPLPRTPVSASNPLSYDFIIQNRYGSLTTINLDKPITKIIEQRLAILPEDNMSAIFIGVVFIIVCFFYYRNYLIRKELEIIHKEFSSGNL